MYLKKIIAVIENAECPINLTLLEDLLSGQFHKIRSGEKSKINRDLKRIFFDQGWCEDMLFQGDPLEKHRLISLVRAFILFQLQHLNGALAEVFNSKELEIIRRTVNKNFQELRAETLNRLIPLLNAYMADIYKFMNEKRELLHPDNRELLSAFLSLVLWHMLHPEEKLPQAQVYWSPEPIALSSAALNFIETIYDKEKG